MWSHQYADVDKIVPMDAWITPSRLLDQEDRNTSLNITNYGQWYAERIAALAEYIHFDGIDLADYADEMPHSSVLNQDYSVAIIADFEQWSGIVVPAGETSQRSQWIQDNHLDQWTDYFCNAYAAWWLEIINRIEEKTGRPAIMSTQKQLNGHFVRRRAADAIFMRQHATRADQIMYSAEMWPAPAPRGPRLGDEQELSNWMLVLASHLTRVSDIGRGAMLPCGDENSYQEYLDNPSAHDMNIWYVLHQNREFFSLESPEEVNEFGNKALTGVWTTLAWAHMATDDGGFERMLNYVRRHYQRPYYPQDLWNTVLRARYPHRPFGPAFYYSTSIERYYEKNKGTELWTPFSRLGRNARNTFFPGYFVGRNALENMTADNYPTAWITEHADRLPADELDRLTAIAPVYDLSDMANVPVQHAPLRFSGDASGFGFMDQNNELIVVVTRDGWVNRSSTTASVTLHGIPSGLYVAHGIVGHEGVIEIAVTNGHGEFSVPLERWQTKAFAIVSVEPQREVAIRIAFDNTNQAITATMTPSPGTPAVEDDESLRWPGYPATTNVIIDAFGLIKDNN